MVRLITASGREIRCEAVVHGRLYDYLHIHVSGMSLAEAAAIFDDSEQTRTMRVETVDESTGERQSTTYDGYTSVYSIQQSPFVPDALLVWMNRREVTA